MGRETQSTRYAGEIVRAGRWSFSVRGGVLTVTDTLGKMPYFLRPKGQPGTIAIQPEDGPENLDISGKRCLS